MTVLWVSILKNKQQLYATLKTYRKRCQRMSLQFIRGTADSDLEQPLIEASIDWLEANPKNEVFYIVPNHMKFEQEIDVLKRMQQATISGNSSMTTMKLQVFSFYRLAWYYLQHTEYYSSEVLTDAGAAMVFRKVLTENEEFLQVYRGEVNKAGFIQQLFDLYNEMKEGNISVEGLSSLLTTKTAERTQEKDIAKKIQDLQLIFTSFQQEMEQYDIKSAEIMDTLATYLASQNLDNVLIVIHGYSHFSARERKLIDVLIKRCGEVKVSLVLDRKYTADLPQPLSIFYESGATYYQLYQLARQEKVPILADVIGQKGTLTTSEDLQKIQSFWATSQERIAAVKETSLSQDQLQLWKAETTKEEIAAVATEIRRLIVEEGYRYKDIQIVTRELANYETLIEPLFSMNEIPVYLDRDMAMEQHPLVEFIQSLFAIDTYNYRYKDILRFLRTELFFPIKEEETVLQWQETRNQWRKKVDITENVVLAYGYEGFRWQKDEDWQFVRYDFETEQEEDTKWIEKEANTVRRLIQESIPHFFKTMQKAHNGLEAASCFYQFLVNSGVEKQLMMWRSQAIASGQLEAARNHEQTWQALMTLLDEYVTIYGENSFDLSIFEEIFASGLEGLRYNKVPTAIDQIQVRSLDLARPGQAKVIFAIGLTDQTFPKRMENKSLLSDEERQLINTHLDETSYLPTDTKQKIANEPFVAYILLSAAKERLYLSYASIHDTAKDVKVSPYLLTLQTAFNLSLIQKSAIDSDIRHQVPLNYVSTYRTLISGLTALKRQAKEEKHPLTSFWQALEKSLAHHSYATLASRIFSSLTYRNIPEQLEDSLAEALYTKQIYTSVSRMESFYRCQYQYFARFGLGLKERETFGLSPAATGDFFHEALDQFFKLLFSQKKQLHLLTDQEVTGFTEQVLAAIFGESRFSILDSSSRMNYIRYQLAQTIKKVSWALKKQSERSGLSTIQTEVLFGQLATQKGIRGLELPLEKGGKISVRGKIDRVDQLITNDGIYLSVVDYKSSHKKFNMTEAYHGLAMQMLTYLDVALMDAVNLVGQAAKPAGSLYLHVQNPILPYEIKATDDRQLLKKFQFDGLVVNDPVLLNHLDTSLEPKQSSLVFPIEESAKEVIKPGRRQEDKFVTEEELSVLLTHNQTKFIEAGNKITSGELELNPAYQGKERIACRHCPFRSVCNFDVLLKENNYQRIDSLSKKEIIEKITQESQKGRDRYE